MGSPHGGLIQKPHKLTQVRDNGFDSCDIRHLRKLKYYFQARDKRDKKDKI